MDAFMAVKRGVRRAPKLPRRCASAGCKAGARPLRSPRPPRRGLPARSDVADRQPRARRRRSGATASSRASRWPTTPRFLDERAMFLGQWGLKRGARRRRARLRGAGRDRGPAPAAHVAGADRRPRACWRRPWSTATSRASARATTWSSLDEDGAASATRFTFPRQRRDRHLCLADFFRPRESGEADVVALPARHDGRADLRGHRRAVRRGRLPRLPGAARPVGAAHRGAGRVLARAGSASELGVSAARTPPTRRHAASVGYRGSPLLLRLPGLPGPGGPGQARRAARSRSGSGSSCRRSSSCTPSSPPTRSSSTTPRPSTSTPDELACIRCQRCCGTWTAPSSTPSRTGSRPSTRSSPSTAASWTTPTRAALVGNRLLDVGAYIREHGGVDLPSRARSSTGCWTACSPSVRRGRAVAAGRAASCSLSSAMPACRARW